MTSNFAIGGMVDTGAFTAYFNAGEYGVYEIVNFRIFNGSTSVLSILSCYIDTRYNSANANPSTGARSGNGELFYEIENFAPKSWVSLIDKNNPVYLWNNNSRTAQDLDGPKITVITSPSYNTTHGIINYRYHQNNDYSASLEGSFGLRGTRIDQNWG